jgi:hypothetical protein
MEGTMIRIATIGLALATLTSPTPALAGGWYLMVPRVVDSGPYKNHVASYLPLSYWAQFSSYDDAAQCETDLHQYQQLVEDDNLVHQVKEQLRAQGKWFERYDAAKERFEHALCVTSDDPRLVR